MDDAEALQQPECAEQHCNDATSKQNGLHSGDAHPTRALSRAEKRISDATSHGVAAAVSRSKRGLPRSGAR